ncbi:hypothetical protein [Candidatus Pantoea multigeneris]|uniref:Uncharacterized protein n=1 Tax=Candidatus Pantoea multigeneris TaxID=2608357 RepID=A0ABX0RA32_9GAMM|nr:hypothetical protein [Pantoea multigeneris]NIF21197.1 hypothetical protein [Pantoea multigeneris]
MNHSDYLKWKLDGERHLAMSLEGGVRNLPQEVNNALKNLAGGFERLSWYSSCFTSKYQEVCEELKHEDTRMVSSLKELIGRSNVILDMIALYIECVLQDNTKKTVEDSKSVIIMGTNLAKKIAVGSTVNAGIAYIMAREITRNTKIDLRMRKVLNQRAENFFSFMAVYGYVHKAALSARRLKVLYPFYYEVLYSFNLEMLYFFIEPFLKFVIYKMKFYVTYTLKEKEKHLREAFGL